MPLSEWARWAIGDVRRLVNRSWYEWRRHTGVLLLALVFGSGACESGVPAGSVELTRRESDLSVASQVAAAQILAAAQAQPGSPVLPAIAQGFTSASGALRPQFSAASTATESKPANVLLPQLCTTAVRLVDVASGASVDISLNGALPVAAQTVGGYAIYPSAFGVGGTVLHRALPSGSEDFINLPTRPSTSEVDYSVALGTGIAGLRLVSGTLEMLDASGTPRLHVSPPYIVGADGTSTDGALAVSGCAVDSDPSAPWGRPVTAPGAVSCTVRVTWPDAAVVYPAILDPRWTTTGSMATARFEHTLLLLSTGKALVAGGRSTTSGTTGLTTAELYDPTSGTWSPTGSMAHGRRLHSMTQLGSSSNGTTSGKILVAGGISGTTSTNSTELYSPSVGTWIAAGNLDTARHAHTATSLADGRVLAVGGLNGTTMLTGAALYNPASGAGSWVATTGPVPPGGIKNHTATLIQTTNPQLNNHVLLVGGNNGSSTVSAVYLFDPVQNAFSTLASIPSPPREQHTAVTLTNSNGKVLVAGGKNGSTVLASAIVFDPSFSNGSWSSAGTMNSPRVGHTMTQLPNSIVANGQLLVAGGSSTGSDTLASAELFSGTSTWTVTPSMPGPLQGQQAVLLGGNMVLVGGGLSSTSTVQTAAYLYDASFGLSCTSNSQCSSGFCVSSVCCNTSCTGACGACNLAGHLGTCTALTSGTVCRASAGSCDVAETCNGTALSCPADGFASSSTVCRAAADVCDAAETCTGTSASCPADAKKASGTACTDDGNPCTLDQCDGTHVACQHPAGNAGVVCRAAADVCDAAETCTGTSTSCPADAKKASGAACTDDGNPCTQDQCDGADVACQHPAGNAGVVCRAVNGECDLAETCTGTSATCPADGRKPSGTACTDDGNVCTLDQCDGSSASCQHLPGNPGTVCRAQNGECDVAEACTGTSATCPTDGTKPSGTACADDGNVCTLDQCDGTTTACQHPPGNSGVVCRSIAGSCDVAEACTGTSPSCPSDTFASAATVCRPAAGVCDAPETCTGMSADCPIDGSTPPTSVCAAPQPLATLDDSLAKITVSSVSNADGSYTYAYSVTNLDQSRYLRGLDVGFNRVGSILELVWPPVDWTDDSDGGLTAVTATAPPGWNMPRLTFFEESSGHFLHWTVANDESGVAPGATLGGFSVTVPQSDPTHTTSHWTARFASGLAAGSILSSELVPFDAVNCGGSSTGSFTADTFFSGGTAVTGGPIDVSGIVNPAPAAVYSSARAGAFTYSFVGLVPGSPYVVRLHFADLVYQASGQRVFDVTLNGSNILTSFDIVREYGQGKGGVIEYPTVAPASGSLVLGFVADHVDVPMCNGIEIIGGTTTPPPPIHLVATPHNGSISLSWDNIGTPSMIVVYRGTSSGGESIYGRIPPTGAHNTLPPMPVVNGQTYYFRLSALSGSIEGERTVEVVATPMANLP
jgi:hypothetical protein